MLRIKNIIDMQARPSANKNAPFESLNLVKGSGTMAIDSKKTAQGRLFEITLKLKVKSPPRIVFSPLVVRVCLLDRTYEFGNAYLPVIFDTSEEDLLSLSVKYESDRAPAVLL